MSRGRRVDQETRWWTEEGHKWIQSKRLARKMWDTERTEESRREYREMQRKVKVEVATKGLTMTCLLGWTARRERLTYTG